MEKKKDIKPLETEKTTEAEISMGVVYIDSLREEKWVIIDPGKDGDEYFHASKLEEDGHLKNYIFSSRLPINIISISDETYNVDEIKTGLRKAFGSVGEEPLNEVLNRPPRKIKLKK